MMIPFGGNSFVISPL